MEWLQRYKEKEIKKGNSNTRYYHAKVNDRRIRNMIVALKDGDNASIGKNNLKSILLICTEKKLLGQLEASLRSTASSASPRWNPPPSGTPLSDPLRRLVSDP